MIISMGVEAANSESEEDSDMVEQVCDSWKEGTESRASRVELLTPKQRHAGRNVCQNSLTGDGILDTIFNWTSIACSFGHSPGEVGSTSLPVLSSAGEKPMPRVQRWARARGECFLRKPQAILHGNEYLSGILWR